MLESAAFTRLHHAEHVSLRLVMTSNLSLDVSRIPFSYLACFSYLFTIAPCFTC